MKNILKFLLPAILLSGCYEDKGNYDYTLDSMNEITSVKFTPDVIETTTGKLIEARLAQTKDDTVHIVVDLEQTLEKDFTNLDFRWYRTYSDNSGKVIKDTVYTKGFLDVILPKNTMVEQDVLLQIYDNTTELSHYSAFKFKTRPPFKNSLFVLHGEKDERQLGNIEIIGKDTIAYTNIKLVTNDENIYQYATGFDYTAYENNISLTLFSENEGTRIYDPFGMKIKFTASEIFKPYTTNFPLNKIVRIGDPGTTSYCVAMLEDGQIYTGNNLPVLFKTGYNKELSGNTEHQTEFKITAATMTHDCYFFWDDQNKRFLYSATEELARREDDARDMNLLSDNPILDTSADLSQISPSPADMTGVFGYINHQQGWEDDMKDFYFIFKDQSGNYYRYELRTGEKSSTVACTIESVKALDGFNPSDPSLINYCSCFSTNYIFYANGNTIYRYNVSNGDHVVVYSAPDGYNVTMMKFRTGYYSPGSANQVGDLNRIMSIGLYKENGAESYGAIAEVKFTTAADVDEDFKTVIYEMGDDGKRWGRIKDMQFAHEYYYGVADYLITE